MAMTQYSLLEHMNAQRRVYFVGNDNILLHTNRYSLNINTIKAFVVYKENGSRFSSDHYVSFKDCFRTAEAANEHIEVTNELKFDNWYESCNHDNAIWANGLYVPSNIAKQWFKENKEQVLMLFGIKE